MAAGAVSAKDKGEKTGHVRGVYGSPYTYAAGGQKPRLICVAVLFRFLKKYLHLYEDCGKLLMLRIKRWSAGTSHGKEQFLNIDDVEVLRTSKK